MLGYTEAPHAWRLTRGMARLVGVNLPQAVVDGWLSREELATLVMRCENCTCHGRCDNWLAQSGEAHGMPAFCPNKPGLEALSPA